MKKFRLVAALSAALVLAFGSVASAAETGKIFAATLPEWTEAGGGKAGLGQMLPQGDAATMNGGDKGASSEHGVLGLGPVDVEHAADAKIDFKVEVRTAGKYEVKLCYMAKHKDGQTRCADAIVNGGERIHLNIVGQAEWNVPAYTTFEADLVQGANHIVLVNVENFDNSTYKAINVDYIEWTLKEEAVSGTRVEAESGVGANLADPNPQDKGGASVIGLKSTDDNAAVTGTLTFKVTVDKKGEYELVVRANAKGERKAALSVNGTAVSDFALVTEDGTAINHADYNTYGVTKAVKVVLEKGENTIVLSSVLGSKAPNIDYVEYKLVKELQDETTTAPAGGNEGGSGAGTPSTADSSNVVILLAVACAAVAVAAVASKKQNA